MALPSTNTYLFAGDSLTEGVYGENYVERVARALYLDRQGLGGEIINAGRGGDTALALLARIDGLLERYRPTWVILAIGTNDVWHPWLGSHSLGWRMWLGARRLRSGQKPAADLDQFASAYRALIDKSQQAGARVLVCTASPIGERIASSLNGRVARLNGVIKHIAADCQVPVADVWQSFVEELAVLNSPSGYVPGEWLFTWFDRRRAKRARPDEVAERRRLHLTFDGLHLNSRGADLWARTILDALRQARAVAALPLPDFARRFNLSCFSQDPIDVCCSPGWEERARELAAFLADVYAYLVDQTSARPQARLALFNAIHWAQSDCPHPYPRPSLAWDGQTGTFFVPDAYPVEFLRALHIPETVAAWRAWPSRLAELGEPAQARALADMLAVQEMARLFLLDLRVAPSDPLLRDLMAAYLTQVVLHATEGAGPAGPTTRIAGLWNAWGEVLARAGLEEGRVRLQARALFEEHGAALVPAVTGQVVEGEVEVAAQVAALLGTETPEPQP